MCTLSQLKGVDKFFYSHKHKCIVFGHTHHMIIFNNEKEINNKMI